MRDHDHDLSEGADPWSVKDTRNDAIEFSWEDNEDPELTAAIQDDLDGYSVATGEVYDEDGTLLPNLNDWGVGLNSTSQYFASIPKEKTIEPEYEAYLRQQLEELEGKDDEESEKARQRIARKLKYITLDEERAWAARRDQAESEKEKLTVCWEWSQHYRRWVVSVIHRNFDQIGAGVDWTDLYAEGEIALVKALMRWDPTHKVRVMSFADKRVVGGVQRWMENNGWGFKHTRSEKPVYAAYKAARKRMIKKGLSPTRLQVAEKVQPKFPHLTINDIIQIGCFPFASSLDAEIEQDDGTYTLHEIVGSSSPSVEHQVEQREVADKLIEALATLDADERKVVEARHPFIAGVVPITFDELGENMGVSRETVRRTYLRAINKLKDPKLGLQEMIGG